MGWLSDIVDIGSLAVGAMGLFGGSDEPAGYEELKAAAEERARIARLMDPTTAEHKAAVTEEENRLRGQFASDLKDLMVANRRAAARGRSIINPERRDETMASALATNRETSRDQARSNVMKYLSGAASAQGGVASSFSSLANMSSAIDAASRKRTASGFESIFSGLKSLDKPSSIISNDPWSAATLSGLPLGGGKTSDILWNGNPQISDSTRSGTI